MKCSKQFELTVQAASGCVDWTALLWGAPLIFNGSFTPSSATGDTFSCVTLGGIGASYNDGLFSYNGSGCNCQCNVLITGDPLPNDSVCKITVYQVAPYSALLCFAAFGAAPGGHLISWAMPDTLGATINYGIHVGFQSLPGSAVTTLYGVLSNL